MPKTIDYPRTTYLSAWEIAEVVDDTGGKCAIETCARKLSRKVSGSFKAIIGSAVKFGLVTSKRELLTTTNLFRRIKHAYDKQEEKIYHREAFLHPPLFTQICRKFRNRELPVHMFDVMLIREFGVEEINAQNVAKAFVDGARMVGIIDERNIIADIDLLAAQTGPRRELASVELPANLFKQTTAAPPGTNNPTVGTSSATAPDTLSEDVQPSTNRGPAIILPVRGRDAVSSLFGLDTDDMEDSADPSPPSALISASTTATPAEAVPSTGVAVNSSAVVSETYSGPPTTPFLPSSSATSYSIHISGPGINTQLLIQDADDLIIVSSLLEKIRKRLS
ncbi:hypothetical protein [Hymenobacter algoricola]|uniref:Uncharacterized protein n=1 Tax=Hymenobacter algoricola TaxID=486267 RepID=A0ABP7NA32_9BACT